MEQKPQRPVRYRYQEPAPEPPIAPPKAERAPKPADEKAEESPDGD